jgi:hypothetical protein
MEKTENINNSDSRSSNEISLRVLLLKIDALRGYLFSKWILILCISVVGSVLGLTYSFLKKPVYVAELSFALEDDKSPNGGLGAAMGLASQFGVDLGGGGGGAFSGDNLLALMKSRSMVERTLLTPVVIKGQKQTLAEFYISFNNYRKKWADKPELVNVSFSPGTERSKFKLAQDSILGVFFREITQANLSVDKVDKKLSIISVKVKSENELFAKFFTQVLAKTVSDFYVATKTKKSVQNVNILQRQTDSVRRELDANITGAASSADFNPNPNPTLQILRVPSQKRQVNVQANTAILTQLIANLEISKVALRKETPLIQIIDQPILPLEIEKVGKIKGLVLGGIIGAFLVILALTVKYIYKIITY